VPLRLPFCLNGGWFGLAAIGRLALAPAIEGLCPRRKCPRSDRWFVSHVADQKDEDLPNRKIEVSRPGLPSYETHGRASLTEHHFHNSVMPWHIS